jgi:tRNA nucleotidyltransferase (CCA-adding enzyme)
LKSAPFLLPEGSIVQELARAVTEAGGRLLVVGGWVRDQLNHENSKDLDLEIFGLTREQIDQLLSPFGFSKPVGRHFPVWRQTRAGIDVAYPRADDLAGLAKGADSLESAFREASRHRDLTINAIGWDPRRQLLIDPWDGHRDLIARRLRAVSEDSFISDPLRVLRVARLHARLQAEVDPALAEICRGLDLLAIPVPRVAGELLRILSESRRPSRAFQFLAKIDQLRVFGPIDSLRGVRRDGQERREGEVFRQTLKGLDEAALIATEEGLSEVAREQLLLASLCRNLGQAESAQLGDDGRIGTVGQEDSSARRTQAWLTELGIAKRTVTTVVVLVSHHLVPAEFGRDEASMGAYRRLARKLATGGVTVVELERLARANHLGQRPEGDLTEGFGAGVKFLQKAGQARIREGVSNDVVTAALLISRGIDPGPEMGRLLDRCREIQDETGSQNATAILDQVFESTQREVR